jgi:hypothetical protein
MSINTIENEANTVLPSGCLQLNGIPPIKSAGNMIVGSNI